MDKGIVFNIQRYSLHDGGGIRTIVFLKGCPLSCEWCSNPESQVKKPQVLYTGNRCMGCGRCVEACPSRIEPGSKVKDSSCILCGKCVNLCPTGALEMVGMEMTVDEVIDEVEKDREFYETSGGGVTISGGEPLVQWEFAAALASKIKQRYYHVAIETTGYAPWERVEKVVSQCDLILYDIKHMDSKAHEEYIGVPNKLIIENAEKIAASKLNIVFRIPLMGGINDDEYNILKTAEFAKKLEVKEIHLLPYHRFGEAKYGKLELEYKCRAVTPSDEKVEQLKKLLEQKDILVKIGG